MYTTKHLNSTLRKFATIAFLPFLMGSCETEIPLEDSDPPNFSIQITGDGFSETFDQDTDFDSFQLNLKRETTYDFILTGADQGGLKRLEMYFTPDYIDMNANLYGPWQVTTLTFLTDLISWNGDRSSPLTGTVLDGSFTTKGDNVSLEISLYLLDYGGDSGSSNSSSAALNIFIDDHETEIVFF
ncbi:hypothetical protein [Zobellia sp. OII3]|uniref:hypothetical protein n=1 Tax=Zobellia sp. OII3 TaxID=2034520 RepID=UPI000F4D45A6|nr:hypothetical protein [Zobellia sp. OII3]